MTEENKKALHKKRKNILFSTIQQFTNVRVKRRDGMREIGVRSPVRTDLIRYKMLVTAPQQNIRQEL